MTFPAFRRPLSAVLALAVAVVVPVLTTGGTRADAEPVPVKTAMRSYGLQARTSPDPAPGARGTLAARAVEAESPGVRLDGRAHVLGVTWPRGRVAAAARVQVRESRAGLWGPWQDLETDTTEAPDPGTPEARAARGGTAPWISTADAVQARVLGDTVGNGAAARLDVVDATTTAADAAVTSAPAGAASAAAVKPTILTRKAWGADESIRHARLSYGEVKAAVVHHTVGSNAYSSAEVPSIIRGIYVFHTNGRDWGDIGYNFLVDRFGRTWEGRYGGVTKAVVGAHSFGVNSQTFGTSVLGTFDTATPPAAVVTAQSKLIAWKLGLSMIDPAGTAVLDGKGTVPAVIGHRDVFSTECPGARLYAKLGEIRTRAHAYQGTMIYRPAIGRSTYSYGGSGFTFSGKVSELTRWTLTVRSLCRPENLVTLTGSASTRTPISGSWNGRLPNGAPMPPGTYRVELGASTGTGTANRALTKAWVLTVVPTAGAPRGYCPPRLQSADRYAAAVDAARTANATTRTVVLANGQDPTLTEAMLATPYAAAVGGVVLLTEPGSLPAATVAEITRRKASTVTIVGSPTSVSSAVYTRLRALGVTSVNRVSGADRYEVAANLAAAFPRSGGVPDVVIAAGQSSAAADGLVAAGPAAVLKRPILLVTRDSLPAATRTALASLRTQRTTVVGGRTSISSEVLWQLPGATRLNGADPAAVSVAVASWARANRVPTTSVLVASSAPVSLSRTLAAGQLGRPTLYVTKTAITPAVQAWLDADPGLRTVTVVGSSADVSQLTGGAANRAVVP